LSTNLSKEISDDLILKKSNKSFVAGISQDENTRRSLS
jgi:hypothetical protein